MTYAITVEMTVKQGSMAAFRKLIDENAQSSFNFEPGCQRFDVLVPHGSTDKIFLYEIYDDKSAFQQHLKTEHFLTFDRKSQDMVLNKVIAEYELAYEASQSKE